MIVRHLKMRLTATTDSGSLRAVFDTGAVIALLSACLFIFAEIPSRHLAVAPLSQESMCARACVQVKRGLMRSSPSGCMCAEAGMRTCIYQIRSYLARGWRGGLHTGLLPLRLAAYFKAV